jgi:eukaryotic-like serine/threonine-protein kinase
MRLTAGARLGPYEVTSALGSGGMGEVYRARDTRLNRTVAIKVIADADAARPDCQARFEREAKAISNLNHPNICTVHEFGYEHGQQFLVMEFLEGETLADRLRRGPMRLHDILRCAIEVADALSHAHRRGQIHRDLKPANIMLTKSGSKVLDFGLVRTVGVSRDEQTTTLSQALTHRGTVIGTCPYMSPEQLQGREVDARSDIFAFGAVLHEMATGQRAFEGDDPASILAAVLERDPTPISKLREGLPASLDWVVKACLQKDVDDRWETAHDLKLELEHLRDAQSDTSSLRASRPHITRIAVTTAVLGALISGVVVARLWWRGDDPLTNGATFKFQVEPPSGALFAASLSTSVPVIGLSVSPDGGKIAFVAEQSGSQMIWVRTMREGASQPLSGTEGGQHPFWSPDGRSIGFFANNALKRIDINGRGPAVRLADASADPRGGAWLNSGVIVYAPSNREALLKIPAAGGQPTPLFGGKGQKWWPSPLPDGKHFVFYDRLGQGLFLGSVEGSASARIVQTNWAAVYTDPGYLLYLRDGVLMAQEFDVEAATLRGDAIPIGERVGGGTTAVPGFSASRSGVIAHSGILVDVTRIVRYDRRGVLDSTLAESGQHMDPTISADGRKVAWSRVDPAWLAQDIWVFESDRGTTTRLTSEPLIEASPIWSGDGAQLLYRSNRTGLINLYIRDVGTGTDRAVFDHDGQWQAHGGTHNAVPNDWSRQGAHIIYTVPGRSGFDLFRVSLEPNAMPQALARSTFNEIHASLSPDEQRLAFASDESGRFQVYIQSFPDGKGRQLVSVRGGAEPHWRADGRELYFLDPAGKLMAVSVTAAGDLGKPQELFAARTPTATPYRRNYYPSPDGRWFVVNEVADNNAASITVVVNWLPLAKDTR